MAHFLHGCPYLSSVFVSALKIHHKALLIKYLMCTRILSMTNVLSQLRSFSAPMLVTTERMAWPHFASAFLLAARKSAGPLVTLEAICCYTPSSGSFGQISAEATSGNSHSKTPFLVSLAAFPGKRTCHARLDGKYHITHTFSHKSTADHTKCSPRQSRYGYPNGDLSHTSQRDVESTPVPVVPPSFVCRHFDYSVERFSRKALDFVYWITNERKIIQNVCML